nr:MAG TPA: NikA, BACTERIAL CONJUGATION, RELAXASE, DNA [Caudoviricetes sp.]DAX75166.1 MAG TPA: NikA, BACTERIAL CONJUGATION, RELAXASE, DNA [Caudoviricetes sp.]
MIGKKETSITLNDNKNKLGRPIKGKEPRDRQITLRLSESEIKLLEECSNIKKVPRTDVIVEGLNLLKDKL